MSFYIVGSKYGDRENGYYDIFPELIKKSVIAVGFASSVNLQSYLGQKEHIITSYLDSIGENSDSQSALKLFLNMQPGDIVAVKKHSSPKGKTPQLLIGGYAIVNGTTQPEYLLDKNLGHTISVNYFETDDVILKFGYGKTVHKLYDNKRIQEIFGNYGSNKPTPQNNSKGITKKTNINPSIVGTKAGYIMNKTHNIMQNEIFNELIIRYGKNNVSMEQDYVDIMVETNNSIILYEIKSYMSVKYCIREAIGQLLNYDWKILPTKKVEYIIVGPNKANTEDINFLNYIKSRMTVNIEYQQKYV